MHTRACVPIQPGKGSGATFSERMTATAPIFAGRYKCMLIRPMLAVLFRLLCHFPEGISVRALRRSSPSSSHFPSSTPTCAYPAATHTRTHTRTHTHAHTHAHTHTHTHVHCTMLFIFCSRGRATIGSLPLQGRLQDAFAFLHCLHPFARRVGAHDSNRAMPCRLFVVMFIRYLRNTRNNHMPLPTWLYSQLYAIAPLAFDGRRVIIRHWQC